MHFPRCIGKERKCCPTAPHLSHDGEPPSPRKQAPKDPPMTIDKRRLPRPKAGEPGQLPTFTPVPRHYNRHDGWTPERQQLFIEALADTGSVKAAAHAVNMTPEGAYLLRRHKQAGEFRKAWEAALALGVQQLEDVAMHRALHGQDVPVYSYGKLIGKRTVYNDRLLMFLLRNRAPERFSADGRVLARRNTIGDPQDAARLSRLKRQWRKEWEEELRAEKKQSSDEICESINQRLERMRNAWLDNMTKRTRALYDAYKAAEEEDEREGRSGWREQREAEDRVDEEEALWELAEEALEDAADPEAGEGGEGRELPRFLTHGDAELGVPRRRGEE